MLKKHPLIIFLTFYFLIWFGLTELLHSSTTISSDTVENVMWGLNPAIMYDKHPGLGALFLKPFLYAFSPLTANLICVTICLLVSWLFLHKINKMFFEKREAIFVTILSISSFFYMGEYFIQYNQNIILLPFWLSSAYFFIKAIKTNHNLYWILTTISVALGVYAKFQIAILAFCMLIYLCLKLKKEYISKIILCGFVGAILISPAIIALYNMDFMPLKWATFRFTESQNILLSILNGFFDIFFQFLNFAVAIIVVSYLLYKNKIQIMSVNTLKNDRILLSILGITPYFLFIIMEMKTPLPIGWLVCSSSLILPAIFLLLRINLKQFNLYKLVVICIIVNIVYFTFFNINSFFNYNMQSSNMGNNIATSAQEFIEENNLPEPQYASGDWKYSLYLPAFMSNHPKFIRDWQNTKPKGTMLLVFRECKHYNQSDLNGYNIISQGCQNVKLLDKYYPQSKPFTYIMVDS